MVFNLDIGFYVYIEANIENGIGIDKKLYRYGQ
jgi:hypothetical protein